MNNKCYVSGKISGMNKDEAYSKFKYDAIFVLYPMKLNAVIPFEIKPIFGIDKWFCHMVSDIWQLLKCSNVYFMKNWKDSRGAKIEHFIAVVFRKNIIMEL